MKSDRIAEALRGWWETPDPGLPEMKPTPECPSSEALALHAAHQTELTPCQQEHADQCSRCRRLLALLAKLTLLLIALMKASWARAQSALGGARLSPARDRRTALGVLVGAVALLFLLSSLFASDPSPAQLARQRQALKLTGRAVSLGVAASARLPEEGPAAIPVLLPLLAPSEDVATSPTASSAEQALFPPKPSFDNTNPGGLMLAAQRTHRSSAHAARPAPLAITISKIGGTEISPAANSAQSRQRSLFYYVTNQEIVRAWFSGALPTGASVYALVRRRGEREWNVQASTLIPSTTGSGGNLSALVQFGGQSDRGAEFELSAIISREALPTGRIPTDMLLQNTLLLADAVPVMRRDSDALVWIANVSGHDVYGDEKLPVESSAPIRIRARSLPYEGLLGLAVRPVTQGPPEYWVQDYIRSSDGAVVAHFGRPGWERFSEFEVMAFAVYTGDASGPGKAGTGSRGRGMDRLPPIGVRIGQERWQSYRSQFLQESKVVRVIKWDRRLKIDYVDGKQVLPNQTIGIGGMADVRGTLGSPLNPGERLWIVCLPKKQDGKPWVAGETTRSLPDGQWILPATPLWDKGHPLQFNVVAVISKEDLSAKPPEELLDSLNSERTSERSARVQVMPDSSR
ncbi:MAG TPA: hypothetical protein VKU00_08480 [Chthonomonadaceae bacterium]|nr:hypothetical protein [Chthonomonadaceae bacterium]